MQDAAPPPHLAAHVEGVWAAADVLLRRVARLLRRRVGAANQLRARERFDEAAMAAQHAALYAAVLGRPSFP